MRAKIVLSYDGSRFNGFQIQKEEKNTVSEVLKRAFLALNIDNKFIASGRTDKGVHATSQVLHIDLPPFWSDIERLRYELNKVVMPHIYIKSVKCVDKDFHARYSAKKRVYRYIVSTESFSVFKSPYITFISSINEEKIKEAIKLFEGSHNFKNFKKTGSDTKSDVREIYKADFYKYKEYNIFYFEANGFLRSQIRMMVAFLIAISDGKLSKNKLKLQLNTDEIFSTKLAPPNGLYLSKIKY